MLIFAHTGLPPAPHDAWGAWSFEPFAVGALLLFGLAYRLGLRAMPRPDGRGKFFWAGIGTTAVALISPLDGIAASLASAHMVQHMLLVVVAAPLVATGRPMETILRASPRRWRKSLGRLRSRTGLTPGRLERLGNPLLAWLALTVSLWFWHSSRMYGLALQSDLAHGLEHFMFLGAAVWFWSVVLRGMWSPHHSVAPGILLLFTIGIQAALLSVILIFSEQVWYPAYSNTAPLWGLTALEDQQLAGLLMWLPGGVVYTGAALAMLGRWIGDSETAAIESGIAGSQR